MKRRDFITLLGGAAAVWPFTASAQQSERPRRVAVVSGFAESDGVGQARMAAFRETIAKLGWIDGRNIRIDYRWGVDPDRAHAVAAELAAAMPDVIFAIAGHGSRLSARQPKASRSYLNTPAIRCRPARCKALRGPAATSPASSITSRPSRANTCNSSRRLRLP
jgi:hypothetical protein